MRSSSMVTILSTEISRGLPTRSDTDEETLFRLWKVVVVEKKKNKEVIVSSLDHHNLRTKNAKNWCGTVTGG